MNGESIITWEVAGFAQDLGLAAVLIAVTAVLHAIILDQIFTTSMRFMPLAHAHKRAKAHIWRVILSVSIVLGIFFSHTLQIWLWAFTYMLLEIPEFNSLQDSVYFSTVAFTTLGFGDITLKDQWRVLSGIEAANGIVLFGWSTAFLFEMMGILYPRVKK